MRAAVDVVMHGTGGLTGELQRRTADLDGQVAQLRGQVETLQTVAAGLEALKSEVASLAGPSGRLVTTGSPWWSLLPFTTHRIQMLPGLFTAETGVEPRERSAHEGGARRDRRARGSACARHWLPGRWVLGRVRA